MYDNAHTGRRTKADLCAFLAYFGQVGAGPAWMALFAASDFANFSAFHLKKLSTVSVRAQRARSSTTTSTRSRCAAFISGVWLFRSPRLGSAPASSSALRDLGPAFFRGHAQRRSVAPALVHVGAALDQRGDQRHQLAFRRKRERRVAFVVDDTGVGAGLQQDLAERYRDRGVGIHGLDERCPVVVGFQVDVGPGGDQTLGDGHLVLSGPGDVAQRGHPRFVLRVGIDFRVDEHVHHRELAFGGRTDQQGAALRVPARLPDVEALRHQGTEPLRVIRIADQILGLGVQGVLIRRKCEAGAEWSPDRPRSRADTCRITVPAEP